MRFKPGDIAISKSDPYPIFSKDCFLVIGVGLMRDMDGMETEMVMLDNPQYAYVMKPAIHFYTPNEIKVMVELEKSK